MGWEWLVLAGPTSQMAPAGVAAELSPATICSHSISQLSHRCQPQWQPPCTSPDTTKPYAVAPPNTAHREARSPHHSRSCPPRQLPSTASQCQAAGGTQPDLQAAEPSFRPVTHLFAGCRQQNHLRTKPADSGTVSPVRTGSPLAGLLGSSLYSRLF